MPPGCASAIVSPRDAERPGPPPRKADVPTGVVIILNALTVILTFFAVLAAVDACVRAFLVVRAGRKPKEAALRRVSRWLVVIPARSEGEHIRATVESLSGSGAEVCVIADGADPSAEAIARACGATVVTKEPPGPTKAAALAWFADNSAARLQNADAVLLLDVGSRVAPHFFEAFAWADEDSAAQSFLKGTGEGVGGAAAASERFVQAFEDRGRVESGWSARLRGTGCVFRPHVFAALVGKVKTQVEDLEMSLLLIGDGLHAALGPADAIVLDEKPASASAAASQRSRWLWGRYQLLFTRGGALLAAIRRRPAEGLAFLIEIFGRPLSLTVIIRVAASALLVRFGTAGIAAGGLLMLSAVFDVAVHLRSGETGIGALVSMVLSWLFALVLLPRALFRWVRTKRS